MSSASGSPGPGSPSSGLYIGRSSFTGRRGCSSAERRRWDTGLAADLRDQDGKVIDEAPGPLFARLEGANQRMALRSGVRARMTVWRIVAAADLPTLKADPEMKPGVPDLRVLLAALD